MTFGVELIKNKMEEEIWVPVVGYEGMYEVSNKARIRSLNRIIINANSERFIRGRILKPQYTNQGYENVVFSNNGKIKNNLVHRLVAIAFIPNPDNKPNVNHIDCNPKNNDLSNLEWVTQLENIRHAIINNRITTERAVSMIDDSGSFIKSYKSASDASRKLMGHPTDITAAIRGRAETSCGYHWRYATKEEIEKIE